MLPPAIFPCEHLDTPDIRYLNSEFAPIKNPFDDTADIESYNTSWFKDQPPNRAPTFIQYNMIPSVSPIQATLLSEAFTWNKSTGSWVDTLPIPLPPRPSFPVPAPPDIIASPSVNLDTPVEPVVNPSESEILSQYIAASMDRLFLHSVYSYRYLKTSLVFGPSTTRAKQ